MVNLERQFDRVIVISLRRRTDRLGQFWERVERTGWPFKHPIVFDAIDGEKVPAPSGVNGGNQWRSGGGAWGCMQSHRQILERAIVDDVKSLLVLEDDAWPIDNFIDRTQKFFDGLPEDWDGLMLGGQHMAGTPQVSPGIVKCQNCQRTHAYAVRGKYMRDLYSLWHSYFGHCDHIMGPFQNQYKIYAPEPFVIGQGSTRSDISGRMDPLRFWSGSDTKAEIAVVDAPLDVIQKLRSHGVHTGYHRDGGTDVDNGIKSIFIDKADDSYITKVRRLREWADLVRGEASVFENGICVIWVPKLTSDIVQVCEKAIGTDLLKLRITSVEDFLAKRKNHAPNSLTVQQPCGCHDAAKH